MREVRIFWNTPSCSMDKINRNWQALDSWSPKAAPHRRYSLKWILMSSCEKKIVKLPRGSPSHLTSSQTFLGTSISSKTPGKDFKDIERERVKNVWSFWSLWGRGCSWHSLGWCQGAMRTPRKLHKIFFHNWTSGSTLKNMAYGGQFFGSRTP